MPARIDDLLVLNQHISKTELGKYLRDREAVLPSDFGGLGDGVADDRAAIQAAFDRAAADGKMAVIPPGTWNVSAGVVLGGGARGLIMRGVLRYTGTAPATVLTLGDGGTVRNGEKLYSNLQVVRQTQSDWGSEADIGILARNLDASVLDVRLVQGFTIGLRTLGDGRGFEDSTLHLGRILNNRIGLDVHCATATAWNTSVRYYGGHFACATGINPTLDRFGVRFSRGAPDAYTNHNRHVFDAPNFELRQLDPNVAIPFLNETNGSAIVGRALRMEACSPIVARHTGAAQDCEYEVAWANTYQVGIDYTATATRCGNAVLKRAHIVLRDPLLRRLRAAEQAEDQIGRGVEQPADRRRGTRDDGHGRCHGAGQRLGMAERQALGRQLAHHDREIGNERDDEAEAERLRHPSWHTEAHQPSAEAAAEGRTGEGAGEDANQRDANLDRREEAPRILGKRQRGGRAGVARLGHGAQAAPPGGDDGEFREREDAVQQHQDQDEGEIEHRASASGPPQRAASHTCGAPAPMEGSARAPALCSPRQPSWGTPAG